MIITIVGPSADIISGSLLRPINIYYSLNSLRNVSVNYVSIRKTIDLLYQLRYILSSDFIIVSGVNPWISAFLTILGRILRRKVITDFHGFAWLEANIMGTSRFFIRALLLISEKISYKLSQHIITASTWLAKTLSEYFGVRKNISVIENATSYIFEKVVNELAEKYDHETLRKYVCKALLYRNDCFKKLLFISPLPSVFKSNILAYKELARLIPQIKEDIIIVITGVKEPGISDPQEKIVLLGYLSYVNYVALLMSSDAVILPYPNNAICGGVRNKILEAGFCRKPIISTKTGMMHVKAIPNIHYIMTDNIKIIQNLDKEKLQNLAKSLNNLIKEGYSFSVFRRMLLDTFF
jgi:glycosyltransferase involved in cell wall biosynthesis